MSLEPKDDKTGQSPWDRLLGEGSKPYAAFQAFLDLGPSRNLRGVAQSIGRSYSLVRRWSRGHRWTERARAWDEWHRRDAEEERLASWRESARRREAEVQQLWRLGVALVQRFVRRDQQENQVKVDSRVGPREVLALLRLVSDLLAQVSLKGGQTDMIERLEIQWGEAGADLRAQQPGNSSISQGTEHPGLRRILGLPVDEPTI